MIPEVVGRIRNSLDTGDMCGCYPECRTDCADCEKCLNEMPEYQSKLDRAKRYAASVRAGESEQLSLG